MDPSGPSDKSSAGDLRETEGGELPKKRRRRCGWDAPAPAPAPAPADQPVAAAAPASTSPSDAVSVGVPSSAAYAPIDPVAAQRLAFQKAQEILASSGLNMVLGSVGNLSHAAAVAKSFDCRVYVGSLNYSVTDVEIRAIFGSIGHIRAVDMPFDAQTQRTKGFCFVDFENANDARAALSLNGVEIAGRPVWILFELHVRHVATVN